MKAFSNKLRITGAAIAALFISIHAGYADTDVSHDTYFGSYSGCALVITRDRHRESRLEIGPEQCALPLSPCSTFKIPNALIGLQEGVVSGPEHIKAWDGTLHSRDANNRDHHLASAIENSVVWYFQSLARDVGESTMQSWLDRINYGNRDISSGIDRFWLGSSLKIPANRQLEILIALKHGTLPFKAAHQVSVRKMLEQSSDLPGTLHAKTGSCRGDGQSEPDHGWFVGWIDWDQNRDRNPSTTFFVINIRGDEAWGWNARPIALRFLEEIQP